ncbi:hypothetical protein BG011_003808 [Mortierella polycephala]|uniref:Methyltransferase type 11 domain-containing protein n=1 Tax=Mortierella polycephala TaxID=41804 RepID=A0A9P6Q1U3_9FUNG|nr:hypothetical protein BG011_003808 [Mortierella polycephala]
MDQPFSHAAYNSSGQLTDQDGSQGTGETVGGGAKTNSAISSKSNLSSFLNSLLSRNRDTDDDQSDGGKDKDEADRRLDDLQEQKQQKKINKMNQKRQEKVKRQLRKQQEQQPSHSAPYQQQSAASTWTALGTSSSSSPSNSHSRSAPSSKAKSATEVCSAFVGSKTGPELIASTTTVPPLATSTAAPPSILTTDATEASMVPQGQSPESAPTLSRSECSSPSLFSALRKEGYANKDHSPSPSVFSSSSQPLRSHSSPETMTGNSDHLPSSKPSSVFSTDRSSTATKANSQSSKSSSSARASKLSFIRGKAGFAWLEKRLPPAASNLDEETLSNNSWVYQQGQLLNEMEIEAAKGYMDRITDQHYLMKDVMAGNYHVPIDLTFKRVLENGCGAGDWTLDMASEMPETDFVGCPQIMFTTSDAVANAPVLRPRGLLGADQSQQGTNSTISESSSTATPITASTTIARPSPGITSTTPSTLSSGTIRPNIRPRNCFFHSDVPLNRLPFTNESFDFVYQRRQCVVLMSTEWQRAILELFRVLKQGGWVEILEPDLHLRGGGEFCKLGGEFCVGIFEAMGRNPKIIHEMQQLLESAGFVNVSVKVWSIPLGWGGVIGQAMLVNQKQFVNEMGPIYVRQGHGSLDKYREQTKDIFDEAVRMKAYINYHVVVGQKPTSNSDQLPRQKQREDDQLRQQLEQQEIMLRQQQEQIQQQQQEMIKKRQQQEHKESQTCNGHIESSLIPPESKSERE